MGVMEKDPSRAFLVGSTVSGPLEERLMFSGVPGREQLQQFLQTNSWTQVCVYVREGCLPFVRPVDGYRKPTM
jgi:hypothetical protein